MEKLVIAGKIWRWGVSNLDTPDLQELVAAGGTACATDQVLYNLTRRGPEYDLLPWLAGQDMPVMAYSPGGKARVWEVAAGAPFSSRSSGRSRHFCARRAWLRLPPKPLLLVIAVLASVRF